MSSNAQLFRRLHEGPGVLLLANCWDAGSARLLEHLGAKAIATTSAGLAWANGYPDGDAIPIEQLCAAVRAITRVIRVPLSVDIEGGYASDAHKVGENVAAVVDAGGVGINLEDGSSAPELLAAKIEQAHKAAARARVELYVNARIDVYLRGLVPPERALEETLERVRRYRDAGADGIFVPKVTDPTAIRAIAESSRLPLNVLAWPGLAPVGELAALGVRRLSAGSAIAQAALGRARSVAQAFLAEGHSEAMFENAMTFAEVNPLFADR